VAPFDLGLITPAQFRFVCPKGNETRPKVKAFHDWLLHEINTSKSFAKGRTLLNAADIE
jgi:LysR family glycine cleavage system transcriptional activator